MIRNLNGLKRRIAGLGISLMVACSLIPAQDVMASSVTMTNQEITAKIEDYRNRVGDNAYWNCGKTGTGEDVLFSITHTPCAGNSVKNGTCTSNSYSNIGWQCIGFSESFTHYLFGSNWTRWSCDTDTSYINPGDVIRTSGHAAVVWKISPAGYVLVAECWGGKSYSHTNNCKIAFGYYNGNSKYKTLDSIKAQDSSLTIYRHPGGMASSQISNVTPTITLSDINAPSGNLKKGSGFGLRGVVSTDAGTISINGGVYDSNAQPVSGYTKEYSSNGKSINIKNTLNNLVVFNNLPEGEYIYYVNATAVNGDKITQQDIAYSRFTIGNETQNNVTAVSKTEYATPKISVSGVKAPSGTLKQGSNFGLRGVVSTDAGTISINGGVYYGANQPVAGYTQKFDSNSNSIDIRNTMNNLIIFNNLPAGDYIYYVNATAVNCDKVTQQDIIYTTFSISDSSQSNNNDAAQAAAEAARIAAEQARAVEEARIAEEQNRAAQAAAEAARIAAEQAQIDNTPAPSISISGQNYPSATHVRGKNFGIRGNVSTNCGTLTSVRGYVLYSDGNVVPGFASEYAPNSNSFDLRYSINNDLIFNNLPSGNYRYVVAATAVNGSKSTDITLIDYSFGVN